MPPPPGHPADRVPPLPAGRAALVCLLLAAAVLAGAEAFWRSRGWEPSVTDSPALVGWHRDRGLAAGPDAVVLLGASRIQLGFDPDAFHARYPGRPLVNLSANGVVPTYSLFDLTDRDFGGTVILSFRADYLTDAGIDEGAAFVAGASATSMGARLAARSASAWQGAMTSVQSGLHWRITVPVLLLQRKILDRSYVRMRPDRHRPADYRLLAEQGGLVEHRRRRVARNRPETATRQDPPGWEANARRLGEAVAKIQSRGGRVALVRFPTTDEHWAADEIRYPKAEFWGPAGGPHRGGDGPFPGRAGSPRVRLPGHQPPRHAGRPEVHERPAGRARTPRRLVVDAGVAPEAAKPAGSARADVRS